MASRQPQPKPEREAEGRPASLALSTDGLSPALLADVDALVRAHAGRPLSFAELRDYVAAAERWDAATHGGGGDPGDQDGVLPREVRAGAAVLRSKTIAGHIVLERVAGWVKAGKYPEGDLLDWTTAYVLAHNYGQDDTALRRLATPGETELAVREWALCLTCTVPELRLAIERLATGAFPPAEGPDRPFAGPTGPGPSASSPTGPGAPPTTGSGRSP
jgi:hypothetical protein